MFGKLYKEESGITALETAIILIAFVVVAAVFAFTMLSAGTYSTERGKEAVYAGLSEVRGSMELRGGVIAKAGTTITQSVDSLVFTLANVAGGAPVDLTPNDGSDSHTVIMSYRDKFQEEQDMQWSVDFIGSNDGDDLLEEGEMAEITIATLTSGTNVLSPTLGANTTFLVEIKPAEGGVIPLERTTPASIDTVMDLR
jgi:flagellin FlaB